MSQDDLPLFSGPELCRIEAHEAVALLKKREVSPQELLAAAFERIETVNSAINATVVTCKDRAFAAA